MSRLEIVRIDDDEVRESPELAYLESLVRMEAARVWSEVATVRVEISQPLPVPAAGTEAVLLVGSEAILVRRPTLAALRRRLEGGDWAAAPTALADLGLAEASEIYTLRGFDEIEARVLAGVEITAAARAPELLPISLIAAEAFADQLGGCPASDLLTHPPPAAIAAAGLHHRFIDYYGELRDDVLPFVPAGARDVLEVGCGRGVTGALLQERLGCRVTGVELNPAVAADARRRLHRVIEGDVETLDFAADYDVVLACELVEHLVRPEKVLPRLAASLRPGGRMILSIPNVGHHSVVADLLRGRWDYLPIGLLCSTHYRFFTRTTLEDWLRMCGLDRFEIVPQVTPLPEEIAALPLPGLDLDSLRTKGFYVTVEAPGGASSRQAPEATQVKAASTAEAALRSR